MNDSVNDNFIANVKKIIAKETNVALHWCDDLNLEELDPKDTLIVADNRQIIAFGTTRIIVGVCWDTLNEGLRNVRVSQFDPAMENLGKNLNLLLKDLEYTEYLENPPIAKIEFRLGENFHDERFEKYGLVVTGDNSAKPFAIKEVKKLTHYLVVLANLAAIVLTDYVVTNNFHLGQGILKN